MAANIQACRATGIFGRVENAEAVANFAFAQRERFILKGRRTYPEVVDSSYL